MSIDSLLDRLDVPSQSQEFIDVMVNWLKRIESILRNGLPHWWLE